MQVTLFISCRKLKNLDTFTKSDPAVHFYQWNDRRRDWVKTGETEMIKDNLNPDFQRSFEINYSFEKHQRLRFIVLDVDITESDFIGEFETSLGNVMGARNQTLTAELKKKGTNSKRGQIIVRAEAASESNHAVEFQVAGHGIQNKVGGCMGMCGEPGPVSYEILREIGG